jgi:hypothetical protein
MIRGRGGRATRFGRVPLSGRRAARAHSDVGSPTPRSSRPWPSAPSRRRWSRPKGRALTGITLWIRNRAQSS